MKAAIATLMLIASTLAFADPASDAIKKQQAAVSSANAAIARANSDALSEIVNMGAQIYGVPATREAVMAARKRQKFPPVVIADGWSDDAQLAGTDDKTAVRNFAVANAQMAYHNACATPDPLCTASAQAKWKAALLSADHQCFGMPTAETIAAARTAALAAGTGCKQ